MRIPETYFVFICHGQTQHNVDFLKYDEHAYFDDKNVNAELTELGKYQAQNVYESGEFGSADNYDVIFCSPLSRVSKKCS